jgi:cyanophycinase
MTTQTGLLALVGGAEWHDGCKGFDAALLAAADGDEVLVLPTAAAYEHPQRSVDFANDYFAKLGGRVRGLMVLGRVDANNPEFVKTVRESPFTYIGGGSPLHLRSVLKGSDLWEALLEAWRNGAVVAASSAGAMVLCDPMVDPRGGAYTVGLGLIANLSVLPHQDTAPAHLKERTQELRPAGAVLAGVDEQTAMLRSPDGNWTAVGAGSVTLYGPGPGEGPVVYAADSVISTLNM